MPLSKFVVGPGKTVLEDDELLVSIACDALPGWGGAFEKVGHRRSLVISVVCLAVLVKPDETGTRFAAARVAIGGIGPVPERVSQVEAFLAGKEISADVIAEASQLPVEHVRSRSRVAQPRCRPAERWRQNAPQPAKGPFLPEGRQPPAMGVYACS